MNQFAGQRHHTHCAKTRDDASVCTCALGKGLARRHEGMVYAPHDSDRAKARRRRQLFNEASKATIDWSYSAPTPDGDRRDS